MDGLAKATIETTVCQVYNVVCPQEPCDLLLIPEQHHREKQDVTEKCSIPFIFNYICWKLNGHKITFYAQKSQI